MIYQVRTSKCSSGLFVVVLLFLTYLASSSSIVLASAEDDECSSNIPPFPFSSSTIDVAAAAESLGLPREFWNGTDPIEVHRALEFGNFTKKVFTAFDQGKSRDERERASITVALKALHMSEEIPEWLFSEQQDTKNITALVRENFLYEFHKRLTAAAPPNCIFNIYTDRPADAQLRLLVAVDHASRQKAIRPEGTFHDRKFREVAFGPNRHRGGVASLKHKLKISLLTPLQEISCFAIPSPAAAAAIQQHTSRKLIEMGAGTGYWSAWLKQVHGIDILAYDAYPPKSNSSAYFTQIQYTDVKEGSCAEVFKNDPELAATRALLLVWPNNPDNVDQPDHFYSKQLERVPVWDVECLRAYMNANGTTVVYVGEREEHIHIMPNAPPESGLTSTREFQNMLKTNFDIVKQVDLPTLWAYDDLTIWKKKSEQIQASAS